MRNKQPVVIDSQGGSVSAQSPSFLRALSAMRISGSRFRRVLAGAVGVGLLTAASSHAATYSNNFNASQGDVDLGGSAKWVATGGDADSGYISVTDAVNSQQGMVVLPEFTSGENVSGFKATFKLTLDVPAGLTPISRKDLVEKIIADALPVRFQIQQHKIIWPPEQRGV